MQGAVKRYACIDRFPSGQICSCSSPPAARVRIRIRPLSGVHTLCDVCPLLGFTCSSFSVLGMPKPRGVSTRQHTVDSKHPVWPCSVQDARILLFTQYHAPPRPRANEMSPQSITTPCSLSPIKRVNMATNAYFYFTNRWFFATQTHLFIT